MAIKHRRVTLGVEHRAVHGDDAVGPGDCFADSSHGPRHRRRRRRATIVSGPLKPGPEAVGQQVVRLAVGRVGRRGAVVGHAGAHRQDRAGERDQPDERSRWRSATDAVRRGRPSGRRPWCARRPAGGRNGGGRCAAGRSSSRRDRASAGSKVTAPTMATTTVTADATPIDADRGDARDPQRRRARRRRCLPANSTAVPDVALASAAASTRRSSSWSTSGGG